MTANRGEACMSGCLFPMKVSREALSMRPMTYQGGCLDGNVSNIDIEVTYNIMVQIPILSLRPCNASKKRQN